MLVDLDGAGVVLVALLADVPHGEPESVSLQTSHLRMRAAAARMRYQPFVAER